MLGSGNDTRPGLAIIVNSITPYGVNLQRAIAAGIPELKIHVLVSHWAADFKWQVPIPSELHVARFGLQDEHPLENPVRRPLWGWRKGGRFIDTSGRTTSAPAAIFSGYRFISYFRLMNYCYHAEIPFFVNNDSNIRCEPRLSFVRAEGKRQLYCWWIKRAQGVLSMGRLGDQFFLSTEQTQRSSTVCRAGPISTLIPTSTTWDYSDFDRSFGLTANGGICCTAVAWFRISG